MYGLNSDINRIANPHQIRKTIRLFIGIKFLLVDKIKRIALVNFHRSELGEVLILKLYLQAEEMAASNGYYPIDKILPNAPEWLGRELKRHEIEEKRHAEMFRTRIAGINKSNQTIPLYFFSNKKIKAFYTLGKEFESKFETGLLIPTILSGLILENIGFRIFKRHLRVLRTIDISSPTYKLLIELLRDEKRHLRSFSKSIRKLLQPSENQNYRKLRRKALFLDQKGGLRSAIAMLVLSLLPIQILFPPKKNASQYE